MRTFLSVVFIGILSSFIPSCIDGACVTLYEPTDTTCSGTGKTVEISTQSQTIGAVTYSVGCLPQGSDAISAFCTSDNSISAFNYFVNDTTCGSSNPKWGVTDTSATGSCLSVTTFDNLRQIKNYVKIDCSSSNHNDQIAIALINDENNDDINIEEEHETQIDEQQEIQQEVEDLLQQIQELKHSLQNKRKYNKKHSKKTKTHHRF